MLILYNKRARQRLLVTSIDLALHLAVSVAMAVYFYWLTGGWSWPVLAIIGGVLIDMDHFVDYFLHFGLNFNILGFFTHRHLASGKIYVLLHSWELVIALWLGSLAFLWITPLAAGMTAHLLIDTFSRRKKSILFYSLFYRIGRGFSRETIDPAGFAADKDHEHTDGGIVMDIKDMDRLPAEAGKVLRPFISFLLEALGPGVISVMAYGSVTGPDYSPKTSDINTAVVLKDASIDRLKPLLRTIRSNRRRGLTAPLFMTPSYINMSLDTFPMEFMMMKNTRRVLYGEDVLADLAFEREDLRRECEYQLKGKLLTIRQAYLERGTSRRGLEDLIKRSLRSLIPVFQAMLNVKTGNPPPLKKEAVMAGMAEEFDIDVRAFLEVFRDKKTDGRIAGKSAEIFLEEFLAQLERLSEIIDKL